MSTFICFLQEDNNTTSAHWHLRFSITPICNYKCLYCNPNGEYDKSRKIISFDEARLILQGALYAGINRVHWTGGEPTVRNDFIELVSYAKSIGFKDQIITTNGWRSLSYYENAISSGLSRINVSLDTLDKNRYKEITGKNNFASVIRVVEYCANKMSAITKINAVAMKSTLKELEELYLFLKAINSKCDGNRLVLKLISLSPNNPVFQSHEGLELFRKENVSDKEIFEALRRVQPLTRLKTGEVEGDNPNCRYYKWGLSEQDPIIGVLAMPSWNYQCGNDRCKKLRVTPYGEAAVCIQNGLTRLLHDPNNTVKDVILSLKDQREKLDIEQPARFHFRSQIGEMRFGKTGSPTNVDLFNNIAINFK
ncbi:MAG: radical SAM protein [Candidatus Thiodiazotropha endolucinida]|nr:radical SAM protein [Candidatus Thiodiazotropha endolucinida]